MCGLKIKLVDMFPELADSLEESDKKASISFSDNNYLENVDSIEKLAGEDNFALISAVKELYDAVIIQNIIQGHKFISDAKIASYEKHMNDLKLLKSVLRNNVTSKEFNKFFRSEEPGTYAAYVKSNNSDGKRTRRGSDKGRTQDDLYSSIKKLLSKADENDSDAEYILDEISKGTFLPKQRITDNKLIPNQLYATELKAILDNAAQYYDFLNEKDESGLTVSERILSVFTFTMPYFVGPTSEYNSRGWAVRKEAGAVMPWNLEEKVDIKESAKNFIENMVGKCTYLSGERVLPKASLLYEKYAVLNEVNNIRVDGEKLPVEVKQEIVNGKLMAGKKLTKKQIHSFLVKKGIADMDSLITGIDEKLNNTMSSHKFFTEVFGTLDKDTRTIINMRNYIIDRILGEIPDVTFDGPCIDANADVNAVSVGLPMCSLKRLPSNMHFCFKDVSGDSLLIMLDMNGICASSGSACAAGSIDPSHVLLAIGRSKGETKGALRLSIDKDLTKEDADYAIDALKAAVARLRR